VPRLQVQHRLLLEGVQLKGPGQGSAGGQALPGSSQVGDAATYRKLQVAPATTRLTGGWVGGVGGWGGGGLGGWVGGWVGGWGG
jgi:hypothetical protein